MIEARTIINALFQDLRYGWRLLRQRPAFAAVAILTLALGIASTSAIFSVVNAVLLKPLPFRGSDRLALVRLQIPKFGVAEQPLSASDTVEFRKAEVFEEAAAWQSRVYDLSSDGIPEQVPVARISASLFAMLGSASVRGRLFSEDEDRLRTHVVLLSNGLWRRRYASDPQILSRKIFINREPYQVIGVMPATFTFPPRGLPQEPSADLWIPLSLTTAELALRDNPTYTVLGRLRPNISWEHANSEMIAIAHRIQASYPVEYRKWLPPDLDMRAIAVPFRERVVGGSRELLYLLLGAVGFLLLIACANVANLMLSRGAARRREMSLRTMLGAGRARLICQLLTEATVFSLLGGALGLLLTWTGIKLLVSALPTTLPLVEQIQVDTHVLVFAFTISILTGLLFGLGPALATSRSALDQDTKEGGRPRRQNRVLAGMVSAQLSLALVLLSGAGLLIRSFVRLQTSDQGFRTRYLLTASIALPESQYRDQENTLDFYEKLLPRLTALPGVLAAGIVSDLPYEGAASRRLVTAEGSAAPGIPLVNFSLVLGDFFGALGVPLKRGRVFTDADRAGMRLVAVVNETLARRFWPGEDPIGKRLQRGTPQMRLPWMTVVGVVGDVNQEGPDKSINPHVYAPYRQPPPRKLGVGKMNLALRTAGDPLGLANAVRGVVAGLDPELLVAKVRTMEQILEGSFAPRRLGMWMMTVFATAALLLAALGIYGVMTYAVERRTREIGIRMALGAQRATVLVTVLRHGMTLVMLGLIIGLAASLALSRLMTSLLYDVGPADPLTYTSVVLLLILIALIAQVAPARRAANVEPVVSLRQD